MTNFDYGIDNFYPQYNRPDNAVSDKTIPDEEKVIVSENDNTEITQNKVNKFGYFGVLLGLFVLIILLHFGYLK